MEGEIWKVLTTTNNRTVLNVDHVVMYIYGVKINV